MTILRDITPGDDLQSEIASIHTQNGDSLEIRFALVKAKEGTLSFGFQGGAERAAVTVDFGKKKVRFGTSDWTRPQSGPVSLPSSAKSRQHTLVLQKTVGSGHLVKMSNIDVILDGTVIASEKDLNLLPEMGVFLKYENITVNRIIHRGASRETPRYFHLAGWQMLNVDAIEENVESIRRGVKTASERGVQLLVTPETSLTGLFPTARVTRNRKAVAEAEEEIRRCLRRTKDAPYLVAGLPVWRRESAHRRAQTRFNASRVYDPEGEIISTHAKIHSCETEF